MNDIFNLKKPISVFWEPTEFCNLRCKHCYTNSSPEKPLSIGFDQAKGLIDALFNEGIYAIGLGGGEPLTLPFLCDLISYVNSKGMQISISTNGMLLSHEYLLRLKEAGLKIIQVSIDGMKETHEKIRGKGTFDGLFEKIELAQNLGFGVRVGYTVNALNFQEIDEFVQYAKANGVHVINFFRYMPYHEGGDYLTLNSEQLMQTTQCLLKHRNKNKYGERPDKFYITFEPLSFFSFLLEPKDLLDTACTAGRSKFVINCDGDVSICNYIKKKIGNVADGLEEIWTRIGNECELLHAVPVECASCEFLAACKGGCRGFSYAYYQKYGEKDNACFKHLILER